MTRRLFNGVIRRPALLPPARHHGQNDAAVSCPAGKGGEHHQHQAASLPLTVPKKKFTETVLLVIQRESKQRKKQWLPLSSHIRYFT